MLVSYLFTSKWTSVVENINIAIYLCQMIAAIGLGLALYKLRNYLHAVWICWNMKGPRSLPLIGNAMILLEKDFLTETVANSSRNYGRCAGVWISLIPAFVITYPEDVQAVLSSQFHTDKIFVYRFLHNFLGAGLLTNSGDKWQSHRRLIQPAFHTRLMEAFVTVFAQAAFKMVETLKLKCNVDLDVTFVVNDYVRNVLNEAVFGMSEITTSVDFSESPFHKGQITMTYRLTNPWLIFDMIYSRTSIASSEQAQIYAQREFIRRIIVARRQLRETQTQSRSKAFCFLDFLLQLAAEENSTFMESDVIEEAITFILAGQDSVGASLAIAIFQLAQNRECQERARTEIETIDSEKPVSSEQLRKMQYLAQCIKESLRMYPSVPLIARKLGEPVAIGEHILPTGSNVLILPYGTHRIQQYYPDPERYDPDRFSKARSKTHHPYAFIPFSAGPRRCIGDRFAIYEIQAILAALLRNFTILPVPGRTTIQPVYRVTLRASGGLWVRFQAR